MTENSIRFAVEKGFFICENDVFNLPLGPIDKLAYLALVRYADTQQRAWPSYTRLAADVGIGKKRAIEAVKTLIKCHLLEKRVRGNRSNVYLVYPARFFCAEKQADGLEADTPAGGVLETPLTDQVVSQGHPQGIPGTPSECPTDTLRVSTGHPISTNISTKKNTLSLTELEREKTLIPKDKKNEADLETVREIISRKGYQVNARVLKDMLGQYTVEEVIAAIECTDFKKARNPLAVIFALLQSGRYVIPKKEEPREQPEKMTEPVELDRETLQKYINQIKGKLDMPNGKPGNEVEGL